MSTNETSIDKAFYSSEHSSTSNRPYVVVNYDVNTSGLNYTSKSVDEGSTFQLTWTGVSSGITWTSSNTSVATVNSSGKVTGVKAGTATITASASGYTSVSCTVTVTLPYGIYYVNSSSGISIGTGGTQTNLTPILTYTQITSGVSKYYQLWEIKHISGGKYSIRSIGNRSHLLYRSDSSAVVYNSSPSQTVPTQALWKIEYTSRGYKLLNNGSSSYALTVNGSDTSTGQFVNTVTYSSTSAQAHWQLVIGLNFTIQHYYDEGFNVRFSEFNSNTANLIHSYNDTVSDRFMRIFGFQVTSQYHSYTSSADTCKEQLYGSISPSSVCLACTHSSCHLTTTILRDDLNNGTPTTAIVIWTGHILNNNASSNSSSSRHSVVITPRHTTKSNENYANKSAYEVEKESTFTLMHELSHQLGAPDHYCYGVDNSGVCINPYCDICQNGYFQPRECLMSKRYNIATLSDEEMYCDNCISVIESHLANHH